MSDRDQEILRALEELSSEEPLGAHLEIAEITQWRDGTLDAEAETFLLDHLSRCEECSALALAAPEFEQAERDMMVSRFRRGEGRDQRRWLPLAAMLIVGMGLGLLISQVLPSEGAHRSAREFTEIENTEAGATVAPSIHDPSVFLIPVHAGVARSAEASEPPAGSLVVLLLDPPTALPPGTEAILEREEAGSFKGVRRGSLGLNPLGTYSFTVSGRHLPSGHYRIRLLDASGQTIEGVFHIEIRGSR